MDVEVITCRWRSIIFILDVPAWLASNATNTHETYLCRSYNSLTGSIYICAVGIYENVGFAAFVIKVKVDEITCRTIH